MKNVTVLAKKALVEQFEFCNGINEQDYNWNTEFSHTYGSEFSLKVRRLAIKRSILPEDYNTDFNRTSTIQGTSNNYIEVFNEFTKYDLENLYFICKCDNWNAVKELTFHYHIKDLQSAIEALSSQLETLIREIQQTRTK